MLVDLDSCFRRTRRQPADEPGRLEDAVRRVEDRRRIALGERGSQLVAPLGREPVGPERVVLRLELVPLLLVRGEAQAAGRPEGVPGEAGELRELAFGPAPQRARRARCRSSRPATGYGTAPPRSAKPPLRPLAPAGDLASLVQADAKPCLGQGERTRAARDSAPDDGDIRQAVQVELGHGCVRLVEPEGGGRHGKRIVDG